MNRPDQPNQLSSVLTLAITGALSVAVGLLWNLSFPINKKLWTSSYVLFAAGLSLLLLVILYELVDVRRLHETKLGGILTWPWLVFGSNAITAFVASEVFEKTFAVIKLPAGDDRLSLWAWSYNHLFARGDSTKLTSLLFALAFTALCFLPNLFLWRRKLFLKI